jgi:hypothetical protein
MEISMTNQELLEKIQNGELPKTGIIRRTGAAQHIVVTTQIDGETVVVPDIELEKSSKKETA